MVERKIKYPKQIAALETLWYDDIDNRVNVIPIMKIVSKMHGFRYAYLTCNTGDEFIHNLNKLKGRSGYTILYLAFHGKPYHIILNDKSILSLEDISKIMRQDFADWIIHFGSCGTVRVEPKRILDFMDSTKVGIVSGYADQHVDWVESAAMDILYFQQLQYHENMRVLYSEMKEKYSEIIARTGFQMSVL